VSTDRAARTRTDELLALTERHAAHNYHPLPVVIAEADGAWVTDVEGNRYLDMLAAYSALNFGHRHPRLVAAAKAQLDRLTLTSRAFHNDLFGPFCEQLAALCGKDMVLTMNTGAEAVETAIKVARRWGYDVKGVAPDRAKVVVAGGNFHGRTVTIVSFSDDPSARGGFGPFTPGFEIVPYGDVDALRDLCTDRGVLLLADEIQSGLGRAGTTFACEYEGVVPDIYILGKALGGGIVALSAIVADDDVLGVIHPGEHGSTFGGNPLACAIGLEVLDILREGEYQARSAELGSWLIETLRDAHLPHVTEIRGRGLWVGIDLAPGSGTAREACEILMAQGVLAKDTHEATIRLAPPLVIERDDLEWALERIEGVLGAV
jgi:ornithine--oxo-acid transaminase